MTLRFSPTRGGGNLSLYALTRGPQGAAATIAVGTTTTGAAGTSASVSNSGSSSAAIFDFIIPRGADAGIKWLYDSSTSMADPGTGDIRLNNATLASVTALAVSATGSGSDVSDWVASWDDSTNSTKGYFIIREEASGTVAIFSLSAVVDNGTWLQLTVAYVSGSLSLTAGDPLYVIPYLVGNKGIDGALSGVVGTDDNGIPRADGTGGTTLQGSNVAIDDTGNITPKTNDVGALGTTSLKWADLFLASGAVINFNSGDVTITHSANMLGFGGAASGYTFDAAVLPSANDAAALGASGTAWSDVFLATGAVLNFNAGNYTITHSAGALTLSGTLSLGTSNAFTCGTVELGAASDTTISRASAGVIAVEGASLYPNIPVTNKSAAYTTVLADANTGIVHPSSDNNARTFTIDSNANVAYPVGTFLIFQNQINTLTISITSDTLTLQGAGSTGSRTLAANGVACAWKVASTSWVISGTGLT